MRWLETLHWDGPVPRSCTWDANVEHILPRTPNRDWARAFTEQQRDEWTNCIGNFCLLPKEVNEALSNRSWRVKAQSFDKVRQTFMTVDSALLAGANEWTVDAIKRRTEDLQRRASRALLLERPVKRRRAK